MNHPVFSAAWQLPQTLRTMLPPASTVLPNRPTAAGDGPRNGAKDNNGDFPAPLLAIPCVHLLPVPTHPPPSLCSRAAAKCPHAPAVSQAVIFFFACCAVKRMMGGPKPAAAPAAAPAPTGSGLSLEQKKKLLW